jgi:RNA polymerase sigma-70 factor (ECF subfamily)
VFDAFFPRLYRYALARVDGNCEEAREAVQQTFCKAFERLDTYRGEASLYGWMCQICRHTIIDAARHRRRAGWQVGSQEADATVRLLIDLVSAPEAEQPDSQVSRMDLVRLIQATLDCLPARYGEVLEWKYVDELSVRQIAAQLSIGPKAAESMLSRARRAFKEAMLAIADSGDIPFDEAGGTR